MKEKAAPKREFDKSAKGDIRTSRDVPERIKNHAPAPSLTPHGSMQPIRVSVDAAERERAEYLKALKRIKARKTAISKDFEFAK